MFCDGLISHAQHKIYYSAGQPKVSRHLWSGNDANQHVDEPGIRSDTGLGKTGIKKHFARRRSTRRGSIFILGRNPLPHIATIAEMKLVNRVLAIRLHGP